MRRDYGPDVLVGGWRKPRRPPPPEVAAERDIWQAVRPSAAGQAGLSHPVTHTHHEPAPPGQLRRDGEMAGGAAAGQTQRPQSPGDRSQQLLAALGYLGTVFFSFLPALVIYLVKRGTAPYLRYHAAQAVNLAVTVLLFDLCAFIVGAMLALDALTVSLSVTLPLATVLWLASVGYGVRAALATARGEPYDLPRWLCAGVLKLAPGSAGQAAGQSVRPRITASASSRPRRVRTTRPAAHEPGAASPADTAVCAAARPRAVSRPAGQPVSSLVSSMICSVRRSPPVSTSRACAGLLPAASRAA